MLLNSSAKPIDDTLKNLVNEIEAQNPSLSILAARQFRYALRQTSIEITIKEPRPFNILEEFIIRAGIELEPPPTADELASVLGLDPIFVKSTVTTLQSLQTLAVTSTITVTAEGRLFYEKGSVTQPPRSVQIYAVENYLSEKLIFDSEALNDTAINLPDLADFVNIDNVITNISSLTLEDLQQNTQFSGLALHVPEEGKIITSHKVISPTQIIWKKISMFVLFDITKDKLSIQVRSGKQILESASNKLELLQNEGKVSLQTLCNLSDEAINLEREVALNHKNAETEARLGNIGQKP